MNIGTKLSRSLTAATTAMLMLATGAAAQDTPKPLNLYTSLSETLANRLAEEFEKVHPEHDVVVLRLVSGALATRVFNEASVGLNQADVVITGASQIFDTNPEWFRDLSDIPAYQAWPAPFKTPDSVRVLFQSMTVYYNRDTVSPEDAPKGWADVADPRWNGRAVLLDPSASPTYLSWAQTMRETYGDEFLAGIKAHNPTIGTGALAAGQLVASGAADIAFPVDQNPGIVLQRDGAPIEIVYAADPTIGSSTSMALPAVSPNPDGAVAFLQWLLTDGLATACSEGHSAGVPAEGCKSVPETLNLPNLNIPENVAEDLISRLVP